MTFGKFINQRRSELELSLRELARIATVSPVYLCNIENDRRASPSDDILERLAIALRLNSEELERYYDLAALASSSETIPTDCSSYARNNPIVISALRTAKDVQATDDDWELFISFLKKGIAQEGDNNGTDSVWKERNRDQGDAHIEKL